VPSPPKHADPDDADHHRDAEKVAKPEISISRALRDDLWLLGVERLLVFAL